MQILFLGYSDIFKKKILPFLKKDKKIFCEMASTKKINNKYFKKTYQSYDDAINNTSYKFVYISLINSLHYHYCKKALNNYKHVIVDKPLTLSSKDNLELIKIARKKKLLILESTVFNYNDRFSEFYKLINFKKDIYVKAVFCIPKLNKYNFRNFKKNGGGCYNDMSSYAIKCIELFNKKKIKNLMFGKIIKKQLIEKFKISINQKDFIFDGKFEFNSEYKNFIKIKNDNNILHLPYAFSQPLNKNTYFMYNENKINFRYENNFYTFLKNVKKVIKKNKFIKYYDELTKLSQIRKIIENKR